MLAESDANRDFTISRRGELLKIMREIQPPGKMWGAAGPEKNEELVAQKRSGVISNTTLAMSATVNLRGFGGSPAKADVQEFLE